MDERHDLPQSVRTIEHLFIPLRNGIRLAARVWLPENAERTPVPAILEYLPYRKRDMTRARDAVNHPYLAAHGYACVRVDMRGSGESDGVLEDEYTEEELGDGVEVIDWLAQQPWCDGNVGMMGISWGGFNSLQIAARQPEALKAIVSCCASDNQYEDNMHYMGGCLLGDHLSEATVMLAFNSLPPDVELVGDRWREMWKERLEGSGLWIKNWLEHQRRDDFWKKGSVCEDYSAIACPVFMVGGWADGYTNAIFRLLEHLDVPRKAMIGPWGHRYPNFGVPGPATGFLQEVLHWFDKWLKGKSTPADDDPMLRVWLQDSVPPSTSYADRPGRWIAEPAWPSSTILPCQYTLSYRHLVADPEQAVDMEESVNSPLSVGLFAGKWCSYSALPDLPHDQREEDGGALVYDTSPLPTDLELLGSPVAELELAADRPVAQVAVRLSDVWPDGRATRITYGLLNLTHRNSDEAPEPLVPGRFYKVRVQLNGLAHHLPAGHRLRLSISSTYFPLAWTPPEPATLTLRTKSSTLTIPERPPSDLDENLRELGPPEGAPALEVHTKNAADHAWRVIRDLEDDTATLEVVNDQGRFLIPEVGLTVRRKTCEWYSFTDHDFESLRGTTETVRELEREDWNISVTTRTTLTSDSRNFYIHATVDAFESGERLHAQTWNEVLPRDLV